MRPSRSLALVASWLAVGLSLSACGGKHGSAAGDTENTTPVIVEITEAAGHITPDDGRVVKVDVGQTIQLSVESDVDDEIHVHSEPEHEFELAAGESETFSFTIDIPGTVGVESHGLDIILLQLQVS